MKRAISVSLALVMILALLASCGGGGPSGTYKGMYGDFTFKGNKVTMSTEGLTLEGTYKINGDEITMDFTFMGESWTEEMSYRLDGKTIYLDGSPYTK